MPSTGYKAALLGLVKVLVENGRVEFGCERLAPSLNSVPGSDKVR